MKKIVMTIALIMAFGLTAYASHDTKLSVDARCAPVARTLSGHGSVDAKGHAD